MSTSHPTTPCSSTTSSAAVESSPSPSSTRTSSSATIASPARTPAGSPSQWTPPSSTAPSAAPSPSRNRPAMRPPPSRSSSSRSSPPAPATLPPFSPLRPKGGFPPLCRTCPSPSPFPSPTCFRSSRLWMLLKICLRLWFRSLISLSSKAWWTVSSMSVMFSLSKSHSMEIFTCRFLLPLSQLGLN
ncbi:hypothetical protein ZIOFF_006763 [Zingiber officinale]|uniref:Uncharacterized protein n=1 Tax=Zingiber officinale TaxID=94328 RepID=A0A8J5LSI0_ZINOF|nr:hypothetical protein ZIOFF_006763 [Zingiber officinale]